MSYKKYDKEGKEEGYVDYDYLLPIIKNKKGIFVTEEVPREFKKFIKKEDLEWSIAYMHHTYGKDFYNKIYK